MRRGMSMAAIQAIAAGILGGEVPWWSRRYKSSRSGATPICRSRYRKSFQGERECARRRRQIERGIISQDQLYVRPK